MVQLAFPGMTFNLSLYIMAIPSPFLSSLTSCIILAVFDNCKFTCKTKLIT